MVSVRILPRRKSRFKKQDYLGLNLRMTAVVQLLSCVQLFANPWTAAHQASLSFTISLSLLKLMSFEYILYDSTNIKSRINKSRGTNSRFVVA